MLTLKWYKLNVLQSEKNQNIEEILLENRGIKSSELDSFFEPSIENLFDPFLFVGMDRAVAKILEMRDKKGRVVVFWDYDVDGVSSTAMLSKFLAEIWVEVSYRLPHRVNDGYWLKSHFIDDIAEKNVKLLITVDCGTRDIEVINYAKTKKIEMIITDHHAVPEIIPENVVALINPKLKNSPYPNSNLSGSGVAFKLLHALTLTLFPKNEVEKILKKYIDLAMLGTVADCMPLVWENRIIAFAWLKQLKNTSSHWLKKLIEWTNWDSLDADIVWFKIWPKLNAAGRMDSPYKALKVLLAWEKNLDEVMDEIETLNTKRKISTEKFYKKAGEVIRWNESVIFFNSTEIEHWIIWLIAGRLCETYNRVAIVLKDEWDKLVASCRSPENISIIDVLEEMKDLFLFFGGHNWAAGFTITKKNYSEFKKTIEKKVAHLSCNLNTDKILNVDCPLNIEEINYKLLENIEKMRPFGIWNPKPLFLIKNFKYTVLNFLWKDEKHLKFITNDKNINTKAFGFWDYFREIKESKKISLIVEIERNLWNGKTSIDLNIKDILL